MICLIGLLNKRVAGLNHKEIKMTLRYAKLSPDSGREALMNLGLWIDTNIIKHTYTYIKITIVTLLRKY